MNDERTAKLVRMYEREEVMRESIREAKRQGLKKHVFCTQVLTLIRRGTEDDREAKTARLWFLRLLVDEWK